MVQVWKTSKDIPVHFGFDVCACIIEVLTRIDALAFGIAPIKSLYFVKSTGTLTINFGIGSIKFGMDFKDEYVHVRFGNMKSLEELSMAQLKNLVSCHKPKIVSIHNDRMGYFYNALRQYCIATEIYLEYHTQINGERIDYCG